ncbi:3-phosphoinositide dependent protein kinase-1 [Balamuthia mandrillaris]
MERVAGGCEEKIIPGGGKGEEEPEPDSEVWHSTNKPKSPNPPESHFTTTQELQSPNRNDPGEEESMSTAQTKKKSPNHNNNNSPRLLSRTLHGGERMRAITQASSLSTENSDGVGGSPHRNTIHHHHPHKGGEGGGIRMAGDLHLGRSFFHSSDTFYVEDDGTVFRVKKDGAKQTNKANGEEEEEEMKEEEEPEKHRIRDEEGESGASTMTKTPLSRLGTSIMEYRRMSQMLQPTTNVVSRQNNECRKEEAEAKQADKAEKREGPEQPVLPDGGHSYDSSSSASLASNSPSPSTYQKQQHEEDQGIKTTGEPNTRTSSAVTTDGKRPPSLSLSSSDGGSEAGDENKHDTQKESKRRREEGQAGQEEASAKEEETGPPPKKKTPADFQFGKVLGEGSYGQVRLAKEIATGEKYAIKILDKMHIVKKNKVEQVTREKEILNSISHPNVISLFSTFQDREHLYFVLEYCPNGDLAEHLQRLGSFSMECVRFYGAELLSALECLHSEGVVHRDIKPENLLLSSTNHLKLIDFGTAKRIGRSRDARSDSFVGTAEYVAPELLKQHFCVKSSDLWAYGCVLYQFITGKAPFAAENNYQTFKLIDAGRVSYPSSFPPIAKDLIQRLLVVDYAARLGASDENSYDHIKSHPFFEGIDWERLSDTEPPTLRAPEHPIYVDKKKLMMQMVEEQRNSVWGRFLMKNKSKHHGGSNNNVPEMILYMSPVWKKSSFFTIARKRQLILTSFPRLFYVDMEKMVQKGEVPWSAQMRVDVKSDTYFEVYTPNRTYHFEAIHGDAKNWQSAIMKLVKRERAIQEQRKRATAGS